MKNSSKIAIIAGLGAIAGGVAGYYLNSDKGRQQRQRASEAIKGQSAKVINYAGDLAVKAQSVTTDMAAKAQKMISTIVKKAEQAKETVAEKVTTNGQPKTVA
jgi:gas vesicle protein